MKPNKKRINNLDEGFKPEIDPRILNAGLKQKRAYYGGGKLNMVAIKGTNTLKQELIDKAEKDGRQVEEDELRPFESDSLIAAQARAELAQRTGALGNARLAARNVPSVRIQECQFQPETKIVRFGTDQTGDAEKKRVMREKQAVARKGKLMTGHQMAVVTGTRRVDESEQLFAKKKGKERIHFMARNVLPPYSPEKLEKQKPRKTFLVKDHLDAQARAEEALTGVPRQYAVDYALPTYNEPDFYQQKKAEEDAQANKVAELNLKAQELPIKTLEERKKAA